MTTTFPVRISLTFELLIKKNTNISIHLCHYYVMVSKWSSTNMTITEI